jgi:hypothetical protein
MGLMGLTRSPVMGPAGNVEFLAHWIPGRDSAVEARTQIEVCVEQQGG